jgi:2-amino-4-hydroxy-6-hydroxymethyldihydropteridine diphosphokinase
VKSNAALLLLGSNLGDRARALNRAVSALRRAPGCRVRRVSRLYETAPVGPSRRRYLNQAVALETTRTPMGLLLEAKILEAAAGRRPGPRWSARPLDVDVIACGRARAATPWLTVPHPRTAGRAFALAPLAEIAPDWKPDGRRAARALLAALNPDARIVRLWSHGR